MRDVKPESSERDIQRAILDLLERHPKVAWAQRMNTGAVKRHGRMIRFGFPGCPDIIGQMKDGRILGLEVKKDGGYASIEQRSQIALMQLHGAVAAVVWSVDDVLDILKLECGANLY